MLNSCSSNFNAEKTKVGSTKQPMVLAAIFYMQYIILKNPLHHDHLKALKAFFKSLNIEVEINSNPLKISSKTEFSLSARIWKDYDLGADTLGKKPGEGNDDTLRYQYIYKGLSWKWRNY